MAKKSNPISVTLRLLSRTDGTFGWMAMGENFAVAQEGFYSEKEAREAGNDQPLKWKAGNYRCSWSN